MRMATASASGIEWLTEKNSQVERADLLPCALGDLVDDGGQAVLGELAAISASVSRDPISGMSARSRSR